MRRQKDVGVHLKNINYPAIARENGVEGTVVIQFVVEKNGDVADAKVVRISAPSVVGSPSGGQSDEHPGTQVDSG